MILSLYDVTGIQPYIFGSNRLKEILGASLLVHRALDGELKDALAGDGELLWSGGGNAVVKASSMEKARGIATRLSKALLERAPGLGLICHHEVWDGADATYGEAHRKAHETLAVRKDARWPEAHFDGAGVTALCAASGEPVTEWRKDQDDAPGRWLSPSILAKLDAAEDANQRLQEFYALPQDYDYTTETNELGRTYGERSYVGVIHVDGNNMGERFKEAARHPDALARIHKLSRDVDEAGRATLQDTLAWVTERLPVLTNKEKGGFELCKRKGHTQFPVRPIVFGGDDITLVCDARIALDLAAKLLERWQVCTREHIGETAHACAGVAIVKSHYPLYRAYKLAEHLCKEAKKVIRDSGLDGASALDFEIHTGGPLSLDDDRPRDRARQPGAGKSEGPLLHARPYFVGVHPRALPFQSWEWFRQTLLRALQEDKDWTDFHTQLRGLAPVLHEGPEATRVHLQRWRERFKKNLPAPSASLLARDGFVEDRTPYLDALELLDLIVPPRCLLLQGEVP